VDRSYAARRRISLQRLHRDRHSRRAHGHTASSSIFGSRIDPAQGIVEGVLGRNCLAPLRPLAHAEEILRHYLRKGMNGRCSADEKIDLFEVERLPRESY
jgi:hypothetical protein